jgi:hypothetical protein
MKNFLSIVNPKNFPIFSKSAAQNCTKKYNKTLVKKSSFIGTTDVLYLFKFILVDLPVTY